MAYGFLRTVTIPLAHAAGATHTDFVVPFYGTFTWLKTVANGGRVENAGIDIAFKTADGSAFRKYHRVAWNGTTGEVLFYIRLSSFSHTVDTNVLVCVGDAGAADEQDIEGTWPTSIYGASWQFENIPTNLLDSTSNNNDADAMGGTSGTGKLGLCALFNGSSEFIRIPHHASLAPTDVAIECWIKETGAMVMSNAHFIVKDPRGGSPFISYDVTANSSGTGNLAVQGSTDTLYTVGTAVNPTDGVWYHIFAVINRTGTGMAIFVNGSSAGSSGIGNANIAYTSGNLYIGGQNVHNVYFNGSICALRIYNIVPATERIAASYNVQNTSSDTNYTIGSESSSGLTQAVSDAISLSDALTNTVIGIVTQAVTDAISLSDALAFSTFGFVTRTVSDTLSFTDAATKQLFAHISTGPAKKNQDGIPLSDRVQFFVPYVKAAADSIAFLDGLTTAKANGIAPDDTISISDSAAAPNATQGDSFALSDSVVISIGDIPLVLISKFGLDGLSLSDSVQYALIISAIQFNDSLLLRDSVSVNSASNLTSYLRRYLNDVPTPASVG